MITFHAKNSVTLYDLMFNEKVMEELTKALSTYPLYEAKKKYDLIPTREHLNEKLLNHYKYREIGFETVGRFLDELKITMCEIMPYYNEMFKSVEIMADLENPFENVDITETFEGSRIEKAEGESTTEGNATGTASSTATANATNLSTRKFSDTPQNRVDNINNYLSEYEEVNGENEQTDTNNATNTTENSETASSITEREETTRHTYTKKGNHGVNTYAHDMNEFRTTIIDVVEKIINDKRVDALFMQVW